MRNRKLFFTLTVSVLLCAVLMISTFAVTDIGSAAELSALMSDSSMWGGEYRLTADIDLSGKEQAPIGSYADPFTGVFDGNGHTVSGVNISAAHTAGLFGVIKGATVKNVTVKGEVVSVAVVENAETKINDLYPGAGGVVGIMLAGSTVENCTNYAKVTAPGNCGGIIGIANLEGDTASAITNCANYGVVESTLGNVGGIAGRLRMVYAGEGNGLVVDGCENYANLTLASEDRCRLAGIAGYIRINAGAMLIKNCSNYGTLTAHNETTEDSNYPFVGGMGGRVEVSSGRTSGVVFENCRNTGAISSTRYGAGMVAYISRDTACSENETGFVNCMNTAEVFGARYASGIVGYTKSSSESLSAYTKNCLNKGDIKSEYCASGIISRHQGFDVESCVNLGQISAEAAPDATDTPVAADILGIAAGEVVVFIKNSYYLESGDAMGIPTMFCVTSNVVGVPADCKQGDLAMLDFANVYAIDKNGLTLMPFVDGAILSEKTEPVIPEETTALPEETTVDPEETTVVPEETVEAPEETTVAPEETTAAPEETTAPEAVEEEVELNWFQKVIKWFADIFKAIGRWFAGIFGGKNEKPEETANTNNVETNGAPDELGIPLTADFDGQEFRILSAGNVAANDFDYEEESNLALPNAQYKRKCLVEENYNVEISEDIEVKYSSGSSGSPGPGYLKVSNSVNSGTPDYDLCLIAGYDVSQLAQSNYLYDMNSIGGIDLNKVWWDQKAKESLEIDGVMFFTTGEITISDNDAAFAILLNKELLNDYNVESPYDMVEDGSWTIENFASLCKTVTEDLTNDGIMDQNDRYGLLVWDDSVVGIVNAAGQRCCTLNEKGEIELTIYNETTLLALEKYFDIAFDTQYAFTYQRSSIKEQTLWSNNQGLFWTTFVGRVPLFREMESDFGVLPYPKFTESQEEYYTTIAPYNSQFICVPLIVNDIECTGVVTEALAYYGQEIVTPAYYDLNLIGQSTRDEESEKMLDIIFSSYVYDLGYYYQIGPYNKKMIVMVREFNKNFTSVYETYRSMAESQLKEINGYYKKAVAEWK